MSPRKKEAKSRASKQPSIQSYFSPKPKHGSTSTATKRLVQSSLTARPLRSKQKQAPDPDDILDLTRSTSPFSESDSPHSSKKRKLGPTMSDHLLTHSVDRDPFGSSLSPLSSRSSSPVNILQSARATPAKLDEIQFMTISPSPLKTRGSQSITPDDPDDIVESSQTQYLHLKFTPSSQRVGSVNTNHVPAPNFTPVANRSRAQNREPTSVQGTPQLRTTDHSQSIFHIPSSQGEVSEPFTPRKRTWGSMTPPGTPQSREHARTGVIPLSARYGSRGPDNDMTPPTTSYLARTPTKRRLISSNAPAPRFASPQLVNTPRHQHNRSDQIPSSQGEPSLEATELGTVESPPKPTKYPSIDTDLLSCIPSSVPSSQHTARDASHTPRRGVTPLLPISNFNQAPSRTPQRATQREPPSSPTDFPSPGRLMSSMGFGASRNVNKVPPPRLVQATTPTTATTEKHALALSLPTPSSDEDANVLTSPSQVAQSPPHISNESPRQSQSLSQTIIPSSQPIHDSFPPLDYDMDPEMHSINQGRLQSRSHFPRLDQPLFAFESRIPRKPITSFSSNQPYFTAPTHHSPENSSQSLPPSQSPIKSSRIDPNQSAAGVHGVFGMLGFGSEPDNRDSSQSEAYQAPLEDEDVEPHIPITYDLPPSSPPPQTPTRDKSRTSSPDSHIVPTTKGKQCIQKTPIRDSPLIRAFEAASKRSKTATPSAAQKSSASKTSQVASSPIRATSGMDLDSSPLRDSQPGGKRRVGRVNKNKARASSPSVSGRNSITSTRFRQVSKALGTLDSPILRPSRVSASAQKQQAIDNEVVESSDAEEAMEIESRRIPTAAPTRADGLEGTGVSQAHGRSPVQVYGEDDYKPHEREPVTPSRAERLPSSVSPSPVRIHDSPPIQDTRDLSPPLENTQTQEESETPWETLRPSQSVSQVFERRMCEEAIVEAERGRFLRAEQDDAKVQGAETIEKDKEEECLDRRPVRPVMVTLDPHSPTDVARNPPQMPPRPIPSTPRSRRAVSREIWVVTPTKTTQRTLSKARECQTVMTPSSAMEEDDPDMEYTYVDETFNPTESQRSFLNRILQGTDSEMEGI